MYRYETHLHTLPVSRCAKNSVRENVEFYRSAGYDGIFITNHFIDGNISIDPSLPYEERIRFYCADCEEGKRIGEEVGIKVFFGVEMSLEGTDFLVYGPGPGWYLAHPEVEHMKKSDLFTLMKEEGALVIQAHPFREADYIDHIRLFPRHVEGVETYNANRTDFENEMAALYANNYGLRPFAGTDNHRAGDQVKFGGMGSPVPIRDEAHFIECFRNGTLTPFRREREE